MRLKYRIDRSLVLVALSLTISSWIAVIPVWTNQSLPGYGDFAAFYSAGRTVALGDAKMLYDLRYQEQLQGALFTGVDDRIKPLLYLSPPVFALLFAPISKLSYANALTIWTIFNVLLTVLACSSLQRLCPLLRHAMGVPFTLVALSFVPIITAILQGQISIFVFALLIICLENLLQGKDVQAGVLLGVGLVKFNIILPVVVIILALKRWRMFTSFLATAAVVIASSITLAGSAGVNNYLRLLTGKLGYPFSPKPQNMPNLNGLVRWLPLQHNVQVFATIILSIVGLFCAFAVVSRFADRDKALKASLALAILSGLVFSYHLYIYDLSLLLIPVSLILEHRFERNLWTRALPVLIVFTLMLCQMWIPSFGLPILGTSFLVLIYLLVSEIRESGRQECIQAEPAIMTTPTIR